MDGSKSAEGSKKNLPLLRAVKEGKTSVITALLDSGDVDVNFQNHCAQSLPCRTLAHEHASLAHGERSCATHAAVPCITAAARPVAAAAAVV